ncbi:MAG: SDR family oxidoreductase [Archangiaceae bacterium]|nr:SDR family oxidoreductase [Archangiaceae bacterium]
MGRPLEGRAALVTGAGTRVGRAIAETLGRLGADVAVHYLTSSKGADEVVAALKVDGNKAVALQADLNGPQVETLIPRAVEAVGPLSILVNSAGIMGERYTPDDLWRVNARTPLLLTEAFAALGRDGDVVNIVDIAGQWNHWRDEAAYCMSKAAAAEMTRCLALRLAPRVRVNAVAPGTVLPPENLSTEQLEKIRSRIPFGRFGSPRDVAEAVAMLLTGPTFITGQIVAVDGGRSLA